MVERLVLGQFDWVTPDSNALRIDSVRALAGALEFRQEGWPSGQDQHDMAPDVATAKSIFVWRGVGNRAWPLHPSLYRRALSRGPNPREQEIRGMEQKLLYAARKAQYGLRDGRSLTDLELLAVLQHHGAGTRLLDVTRNVLVAFWFATQSVVDSEGIEQDGALFGIDVTGRELPPRQEAWTINGLTRTEGLWHWEPPPLEQRFRAQQGAFVFSRTATVFSPSGSLLTSLDLEPQELGTLKASLIARRPPAGLAPGRGRPLLVLIIPGLAKRAIRDELATLYGQDERTIYPDLPGFARAWSASM